MRQIDTTTPFTGMQEYVRADEPILVSEYQRHINAYIFASKFVQGKVVLDIACGAGTGSRILMDKGAQEVVGGDACQDAIREARKYNGNKEGLNFMLLDAERLPFADGSFDVVVSLETIEHLKEPDRFLLECRRVLKRKATLICSTPNKKITSPLFKKPVNPYHVKEFYPLEFCSLLSKHFGDIELYGQHYLNLKNKVRLQVVSFVAHLLYTVLRGNMIWRFLHKIYRVISREPYLPRFREDIDEAADGSYSVILFKDDFSRSPEYIVALAKAEG